MVKKLGFIVFALFFFANALAQVDTDSTEVSMDSIVIDSTVILSDNIITNSSVLNSVFEKLFQIETEGKGHVNIVHIGDSHIQADLLTGAIREKLQQEFGNAGVGFSFPYNLAKTNGGYSVKFSSNAAWENRRNVYSPDGTEVGLSGIALTTNEDFAMAIEPRDTANAFNTIKIITPYNLPMFDVATSSKTIILESTEPKVITHKIKSGDALSLIAQKYGTTVSQIKKANGLRNNNIRAGKTLKIPTGEKIKKEIERSEFIPLALNQDSTCCYYYSEEALSKIYLLANKNQKQYNLNGVVLEKDNAGVLYHAIGVNGAKSSDYNKYPMFFDQLRALEPDLIVISLGTNESFDKMSASDYMVQMNGFIDSVRAANPYVCILVTTPPPSLFKRKYPNTFVADYAKSLCVEETEKGYATWDLFTVMGGLFSVNDNAKKGLMSSDRVHYSRDGYKQQGIQFTEAFLNAYNNFKTNRE
ncbi:peptidoglycan-binding protein [Flavobacterium beibuense F44-8]|uniref:Peptidoglycan-binding protein n=1 Tax=Flavobacterium beibuense F44-8 TaxID=1406840 RepID=A0A0A2LVE8_9FLAO|nr:LysM peptidoglycan-binding domain-containing protein [Flavobacterium beibuense]KGO84342.1 peptidoglycan-binding protein [Flavobacterium beibuense F44-8]